MNPWLYKIVSGTYGSGSISDLSGEDSSYLVINAVTRKPILQVQFTGTVSTSSTELSFKYTGHPSVAACSELVEVFDRISTSFVTVSDQPVSTSDARTVIALKNDASEYIDPTTGYVIIRVTYYNGPTDTAWSASFNWLEWEYIN